ncbi:MAG: thiamine diphosphokinase [Flavonifractor plautii]
MDGLLCRRRGTQRPCGRTAAGLSDRRLGLRRCAGGRCPLHHASGGKGYDRPPQAAVDQALELDYRELLLCGCTGGRLDHTASNLVLLEWIADHGGRALLVDADNEVRLLDSGVLRLTNRPCYHYLSLVPLDRRVTGVTLRGLKYPLTDAVLTRGDTLSVSNEPLGDEVEICLSAGRALLIRSQRV